MRDKFLKRKSGVGVAETIIALAVVTIVTVAAFSLVTSSILAKVSAINKTEGQNFAQDVWECFKVSENDSEFIENVKFATGVDFTGSADYTYTSNRFNAEIDVDFGSEPKTFSVNVTDEKDRDIVSFNYEKGGGTK